MNLRMRTGLTVMLAFCLVAPLAIAPGLAADDAKYVSVTIRGRLTDPETETPMVHAVVRFISMQEGGGTQLGITDGEGKFEVSGLSYGAYVMEIETAEGEQIRGINAINVEDQPIEITLRISDRVKSATSVDSGPDRFFAVVEKKGTNWRRFWREFAGFFGAAAGLGVAAL